MSGRAKAKDEKVEAARELILASGSPRRAVILQGAGFDFTIRAADCDESVDAGLGLRGLAEFNAQLKARAIFEEYPEAVVVGADTVVWLDGEPLGKPADITEARAMLRRLSGQAHQVCTGVAVLSADFEEVFSEVSAVVFKALEDDLIDQYLERVNVLDKAGGYAIQEHGEMIIDSYQGDLQTIIGLPVKRLGELL